MELESDRVRYDIHFIKPVEVCCLLVAETIPPVADAKAGV